MTRRRTARTLLAAAAVAGCAQAAIASPSGGPAAPAPAPARVVVVADASAPRAGALAAARRAGAELRLPRTATEQLSATHWFAARGYEIVGIGLDRTAAVDPVLRRYPRTRFRLLSDAPAG